MLPVLIISMPMRQAADCWYAACCLLTDAISLCWCRHADFAECFWTFHFHYLFISLPTLQIRCCCHWCAPTFRRCRYICFRFHFLPLLRRHYYAFCLFSPPLFFCHLHAAYDVTFFCHWALLLPLVVDITLMLTCWYWARHAIICHFRRALKMSDYWLLML